FAKGADMTAAPAAPQRESMRPMCARLRAPGAHLGPLPVSNLVVFEIGLAVGLALLAVDAGLWGAALIVALITVPLAFGRWHGRTLLRWIQLSGRYLARSSSKSLPHPDPAAATADPRPHRGTRRRPAARIGGLRVAPGHLDRRAGNRRHAVDDRSGRRHRRPAARRAGILPGR